MAMHINVKGKGKLLFFIYSAIVLCTLFFLLIFPALKNPGSTVVFDSDPEGTSVWIGNIYVGATPCKAFVPKGNHIIEFKHIGFGTEKVSLKIGNRSRCKAKAELKLTDPDAIINQAFTEFAIYGLVDSFSQSYQPQPVLTEAVKILSGYQDKARIEKFLFEALKCATSDYLLKDFINAYSQIKTDRLPVQTDEALADTACTLLKENSEVLRHLGSCPGKLGKAIGAKSGTAFPALSASVSAPTGDVNVLGHAMHNVEAGTYILGNGTYSRTTGSFYISEQITKEQYKAFLNIHPEWIAEPEYDIESADTVNASNVSWKAADAYCKWLTERLPSDLREKFYFRLPTEHEWEIAATLNQNSKQILWDWCHNWYYGAEIFYKNCVPETYTGAEKAVRGGGEHIWTRGSQPAEWATPFLGFRVVLTGK